MLLALALSFALQDPGNVRVIDATTKEPIAGAIVYGVKEAAAPVWGEFWSTTDATTGADGWASLPPTSAEAPYGWTIVRADGYSLEGVSSAPGPQNPIEFALNPIVPAEIRVVDFLGRPIPLLHLGFCVGCGHTPDVTSAVTDTDGRATLDCVGRGSREIADVYPVGGEVRTTYLDIDWDDAIDGGFEAVAQPGCAVRGTLLLASGSPAANYAVGTNDVHRGPWCRTDVDGNFQLFGVSPHQYPYFTVQDPDGKAIASFEGVRAGLHRTMQLTAEPWGNVRPGPTGGLTLELDADGDAEARAKIWEGDKIPYCVWDPATGWAERGEVQAGEAVTLELREGSYEVEIGGADSPFSLRHLGTVDVQAGTAESTDPGVVIAHRLPAIRIVRLEVSGIGDQGELRVKSFSGKDRTVEFDSIVKDDAGGALGVIETFAVPSQPFGLWLLTEEKGRYFRQVILSDPRDGSDVLRAAPRR